MKFQDFEHNPHPISPSFGALVIDDGLPGAFKYLLKDVKRFNGGTGSVRVFYGANSHYTDSKRDSGVGCSAVMFFLNSKQSEMKGIIINPHSKLGIEAIRILLRLDLSNLIFHVCVQDINEFHLLGFNLSGRRIYDTHVAMACAMMGYCQGATVDGRRMPDDMHEKDLARSERERLLSIEGQIWAYGERLPGLTTSRDFLPLINGKANLNHLVVEKMADIGFALHALYRNQLERYYWLQDHLCHYEFPFLHVAAKMQRIGAFIDKTELADLQASSVRRIGELELSLVAHGVEKPITKDHFEQFIAKSGLDSFFLQAYGTVRLDKDALKDLEHLHPAIGEYREYNKRLSFLRTNWGTEGVDGRVHPVVDSVAFTNSRISFRNPTLPSIMKEARRAVTGQGENCIVHADWSQFDPTILAGLCRDLSLIADLNTGDLYSANIEKLFDYQASVSMSRDDLRSQSKTVCLSVIYSVGPKRLSTTLAVSVDEAFASIESFFAAYPDAKRYLKDSEKIGLQYRAVRSLTGLCRWMGVKFSEHEVRTRSRNSPIQMMGSTILKLACIRIDERLRLEHPSAFIFLTNNDAILVECPQPEVKAVSEIVVSEMKAAVLHFFPGLNPGVKLYEAKYWSDKSES